MPADYTFRVLLADLATGKGEYRRFGDKREVLGGSGLAAALYAEFGRPELPALDPAQPLIFAIGPLTGCFPMMSKTVCGFKSPYNERFAESHAGGRLALSLRFAHIDALVIRGRAPTLSALSAGIRHFELQDTHYLKGLDVFTTGKMLRKMRRSAAGHRSILRIGPAGENLSAIACINVDSYRHFGRLGAGAVMGSKNLKAILVEGASAMPAPEGKAFAALYKDIHMQLTTTEMMTKYHDLGTAQNMAVMNKLRALPWRNMQTTHDDEHIAAISGETFARELLLRKTACTGCPVGCVHVGLLREQFAKHNDVLYRQVAYDHEPVFATGSMLGMTNASDVLAVLDEIERQGLDAISGGVSLAWATEALERGAVTEEDTLVKLSFGDAAAYREALGHLGAPPNEFWRLLAQGTLAAAKRYNAEDYACVLGQEMAGYATGEVFFVSQAMGLRHSHLDSAGYSYDQKEQGKDVAKAVSFMVEDERQRCALTSMVACLFARSAYNEESLAKALDVLGFPEAAANVPQAAANVQKLRWKVKFSTGFDPDEVKIPKRYREVVTWKGPIDADYLQELQTAYGAAIRELGR
ncbi:putative oxidoreductase YdhV [Fundidesulfovibrio magnetotacticus]|uniref:Putative oxidoreductase YdhV n=1 Tax=Fundidesulfovibrio magnetotacticus TaxID=2730080 RepID=A0A6V8LPI7_9BACT|nr:aldehyde ferredoxin oxidoreductase N-terminal domain-containing protein [Fundidesulfovibrio magnetotacticus]GFK92910.1 putative oxidoreductase YdhV [Fundidesulfovibrio magnetotacticus]